MCTAAGRTSANNATPSKDGLRFEQYWLEVKEQFKTSWPTLLGMILYKVPWLISLRFVGALGAEELAAAALATTLCNVTGLSLSVGLSSAMTTLTGQARGDLLHKHKNQTLEDRQPLLDIDNNGVVFSNYEATATTTNSDNKQQVGKGVPKNQKILLPMVFLYRGLFIQLIFVVPVGLWWISGIRPLLLALGQNVQISEMTSVYLRILTPGLWSYSISWTITTWLQSIEMADVPAYAAALGLVSHIPFNYFFIYWLGLGYLGCAWATTFFQLIQPFFMLFYLFGTANGRARILRNTVASSVGRTCISSCFWAELRLAITSVDGIVKYLGLGVSGIITISEWWASEISIFLSGRLQPHPEVALGGMTLYQSINTFCFMFPVASAVAGSARVGNLLGSGNLLGADIAAKVSVASAMALSGTIGCVLYFTPHTFFPSLFAPEDAVVEETSRTIPLLAAYVFADGVQVALNGIIKGCGRQCITMPIVLVAYWVVGLPIAYYFAFVSHQGLMCDELFCGVVGLVTGMTAGTWVHMLLLAIVVLTTTNWKNEAKKAKERLSEHDTPEKANTDVGGEEMQNSVDVLAIDEILKILPDQH